MLRWMMPLMAAISVAGSAVAADMPGSRVSVHGKALRAHGLPAYVEEKSDLLFTPSDGRIPYVRIPPPTPLLPGSSALPGYYGSHFSYEDRGPYYGGPNLSYFYRLPYACGVYGYC